VHRFLPIYFLYSYEAEFVQELQRKGEKKLALSFNYTFRYVDNVLWLNNKNFSNFLHLIYPVDLVVKDTTDFPKSASYLDLYLEHDINGTLTTKLYDKRHLLHMVFTCRIRFDIIREPVIPIRDVYIDLSC